MKATHQKSLTVVETTNIYHGQNSIWFNKKMLGRSVRCEGHMSKWLFIQFCFLFYFLLRMGAGVISPSQPRRNLSNNYHKTKNQNYEFKINLIIFFIRRRYTPTPSWCLKPPILPNPIQAFFLSYNYLYDKIEFINLTQAINNNN